MSRTIDIYAVSRYGANEVLTLAASDFVQIGLVPVSSAPILKQYTAVNGGTILYTAGKSDNTMTIELEGNSDDVAKLVDSAPCGAIVLTNAVSYDNTAYSEAIGMYCYITGAINTEWISYGKKLMSVSIPVKIRQEPAEIPRNTVYRTIGADAFEGLQYGNYNLHLSDCRYIGDGTYRLDKPIRFAPRQDTEDIHLWGNVTIVGTAQTLYGYKAETQAEYTEGAVNISDMAGNTGTIVQAPAGNFSAYFEIRPVADLYKPFKIEFTILRYGEDEEDE